MNNEILSNIQEKIKNIRKRHIVYGFTVVFVCLIAILGCVIGVNAKKTQKLREQNSQYALGIDTLNESLSEKESIIEEHETSVRELEKKNSNLEQELLNYQDQQEQIDELNTKFNELMESYNEVLGEYQEAQTTIESLNEQITSLKTENEKLQSENEDLKKEAQQSLFGNNANNGSSGGTVYWVAGGAAYHSTPNCVALKHSSNIQSGTIAESGKSGACWLCY